MKFIGNTTWLAEGKQRPHKAENRKGTKLWTFLNISTHVPNTHIGHDWKEMSNDCKTFLSVTLFDYNTHFRECKISHKFMLQIENYAYGLNGLFVNTCWSTISFRGKLISGSLPLWYRKIWEDSMKYVFAKFTKNLTVYILWFVDTVLEYKSIILLFFGISNWFYDEKNEKNEKSKYLSHVPLLIKDHHCQRVPYVEATTFLIHYLQYVTSLDWH